MLFDPSKLNILSRSSQSEKFQKKGLPISNWYSKNKWKKYQLDRSDYFKAWMYKEQIIY